MAKWSFDETEGTTARESVTGVDDKITGIFKHVPGVSHGALRFDGDTTGMVHPSAAAPKLTTAFSIESWIAINTYSWNWIPLVDQRKGEEAGYLFGIDSFGHLGLQLAANGHWQSLTSTVQIPLKKWTHVAATFDSSRGLAIYLDGQAGRRVAGPRNDDSRRQSGLAYWQSAGKRSCPRNGFIPTIPSGIRSMESSTNWKYTIAASRPMKSRTNMARFILRVAKFCPIQRCRRAPPDRERLAPIMQPLSMTNYGTLRVAWALILTWSCVSTTLPHPPIRLVFWQGTNYIPAWVTENGKWYSDEFVETWGAGCPDGADCEPMSDKQNRYAHVRIIESTAARAVVHFRYGLCEVEHYICANIDPYTGWADWADEYYTVYPDGVAVRKQVAWTSNFSDQHGKPGHEFQETMILNPPGTRPEDTLLMMHCCWKT